MDYPFHLSRSVSLAGQALGVFARLDEPERLGRHMAKPSAMMLGGSMRYVLGPEHGKGLGARLDFKGSVLGLQFWADQVVTEYDPPRRKVWQTLPGERLLVIGPYRLGFDLTPAGDSVLRLKVFIDYALPRGQLGRLLGSVLGRVYAWWCVASIVRDAASP